MEAKPKPSRPTRTWVTQPGHSKFSFPTGSSPPFREAPPWWPPLTRRRSWDVQDAPNHPYNRDRLHVRGYRVSGTRRGQHSPPDPYTGLSLPPISNPRFPGRFPIPLSPAPAPQEFSLFPAGSRASKKENAKPKGNDFKTRDRLCKGRCFIPARGGALKNLLLFPQRLPRVETGRNPGKSLCKQQQRFPHTQHPALVQPFLHPSPPRGMPGEHLQLSPAQHLCRA